MWLCIIHTQYWEASGLPYKWPEWCGAVDHCFVLTSWSDTVVQQTNKQHPLTKQQTTRLTDDPLLSPPCLLCVLSCLVEFVSVCECVCVCERARERERETVSYCHPCGLWIIEQCRVIKVWLRLDTWRKHCTPAIGDRAGVELPIFLHFSTVQWSETFARAFITFTCMHLALFHSDPNKCFIYSILAWAWKTIIFFNNSHFVTIPISIIFHL